MKDDRLRLFIAIEIPDAWKRALGAEAHALDEAAPGFGRWGDPALIHLTLVFLGNQPAEALPLIVEAVDTAAAGSRPFTLSLAALGSFGGRRSVRVVWVGLRDTPDIGIAALRRALLERLLLTRISFGAELGSFRPHLTLGRARRDATPVASAAVSEAIARRKERASRWPGRFHCEEIALIRSDLRSTGPKYTPVYRARLSGSASNQSTR